MKLYRKILVTSILMISSHGISLVMGVLFARTLGPVEYGEYSYVISLVAILSLPMISGLPNLLVREIAIFKENNESNLFFGIYYSSIAFIIMISGLFCFILYVLATKSLFNKPTGDLLVILLWSIPLRSLIVHYSAVLNGLSYPILSQILIKILPPFLTVSFIIVSLLMFDHLSSIVVAEIVILSLIISLLACSLITHVVKKRELDYRPPKFKTKKWLQALIPFSLLGFVNSLNSELATIFLGYYSSSNAISYFKVASQGAAILLLGISSINVVIMPKVSSYYSKGEMHELKNLLKVSVNISVLITVPLIILFFIGGKAMISLVFGPEYSSAYIPLCILSVAQLVNVLTGPVGLILNMTGNEKKTLKAIFISLVTNMVLYVVLIPKYDEVGAALSASISIILWNIIMLIDVYKVTRLKTWFRINLNFFGYIK